MDGETTPISILATYKILLVINLPVMDVNNEAWTRIIMLNTSIPKARVAELEKIC